MALHALTGVGSQHVSKYSCQVKYERLDKAEDKERQKWVILQVCNERCEKPCKWCSGRYGQSHLDDTTKPSSVVTETAAAPKHPVWLSNTLSRWLQRSKQIHVPSSVQESRISLRHLAAVYYWSPIVKKKKKHPRMCPKYQKIDYLKSQQIL